MVRIRKRERKKDRNIERKMDKGRDREKSQLSDTYDLAFPNKTACRFQRMLRQCVIICKHLKARNRIRLYCFSLGERRRRKRTCLSHTRYYFSAFRLFATAVSPIIKEPPEETNQINSDAKLKIAVSFSLSSLCKKSTKIILQNLAKDYGRIYLRCSKTLNPVT